MVIVILASAAVFTTATSYDKYDPGYGIYDDGFLRNDYGHYRMESKYAVKYGSYRGLRPALSRYSSGRIGTAVHAGYEPPSPHHSAFYWERMHVHLQVYLDGQMPEDVSNLFSIASKVLD